MTRSLTLGVSMFLCACGAGFDAADNTHDGGASGDGGVSICDLFLQPPAQAYVDQAVEVGVFLDSSFSGVQSFSWTIDLAGVPQAFTELADPVDRVSFVPTGAGPYRVIVNGSVDGLDCSPATGTINVIANGAVPVDYRMRIVPKAEDAPMQDAFIRIYGGADAVLPTTTLEAGQLVGGRVTDAGGSGVAAYVRARMRGVSDQTDYEAFADSNGDFAMRVPSTRYDLRVMPSGGLLPSLFLEDLAAEQLSTPVVLPAPASLGGHLFDSGGAAVVGARVSLIVDGARSTAGLTGADGSFTVLGAEGVLTGIRVAPAAGLGLPSLSSDTLQGQTTSTEGDAVIRYSQAVVNAQVDLSLAGGGAAAGATAEWRSEIADAGTVDLGVSGPESTGGSLRIAATADGTGTISSLLLGVNADLVVVAADSAQGLVSRDLPWGTTPTTSLALSALVDAPVLVDEAGTPVIVQITASPRDALAPQSPIASALTASDGSGNLQLVRGGNYQLIASDPKKGRSELALDAVQPGLLTTELSLPGTLLATGQLNLGAGVAAGAHVSLYCTNCEGPEASRVRASAVVDTAGRFVLRVNDPGLATP